MPTDKNYVFDANSLVSAVLLPQSVPRQAFDKACANGRILLSQPTINELDDVLRRPHLEKYIREEERIHFLVAFVDTSTLTSVLTSESAYPRLNDAMLSTTRLAD